MGKSYSRDREKWKQTGLNNCKTVNDSHRPESLPKDKTPEFEDVVISGLSCRLPESDNMAEFRDNLMNGVDMVTENDRRWKQGIYGLPKGNGKLKDISKFDHEVFGVSPKQADTMDPQMRLLLEVAYEAIVDAGQCPEIIKGSNTGVFIGSSGSESHEAWGGDLETVSGYTMTGCYSSMLANRLSYFFNFKGPSFVLDAACSSSGLALHHALQSIRSGECDAALVGGSNLCLNPSSSVQFQRLGMLAPDGRCKAFDAKADGYCRSEAVVVVYLQKAKDSRRIYCHVVNTGTNSDGHKPQGITFPSREMQLHLLTRVYEEAGINPSTISYLEAHGTGTQAGDTEEANVLADFFCRKRKEPLLIGSVKSNMGHCEAVSGLAAIAKVIVAMEEGMIPGNLHCNEPNPEIPALLNGNLSVVNKTVAWNGGYAGIDNFGFGGSNVHVILKSHDETAINTRQTQDKKLFCCHSRTDQGVQQMLHMAQKLSADDHFLASVSETVIQQPNTRGYRGFKVLNGSANLESITNHESCSSKRPIWYVFTGMGCQWPGMGRQMMAINVFRKAILKCEAAVYPYGIKLSKMLMSDDPLMYEDITHAFVAITAIQVAIVDLLSCVGVKPDGVIGHSVGELGCAYADGCFTAEEAVLVAYWRGRCIKNAKLPSGRMAVVGLTWEEAIKRCPDGVVPACHNASDNVTISGPKETVEDFVKELGKQDVFAKEVNSVGTAFHSYFMKAAETSLYNIFSRVIKYQKERSRKWISTSVKETDWGSDLAKYSSTEYHLNNVLSPVLFHEALQYVPDNAIVVEIAPHCLLKSILKRSLSTHCYITGLMQRSHSDNVEFCFSNLGNLFLKGVSIQPHALLESVSYPVPRGTPMISPLISWKHDHNWQVPSQEMFVKSTSVETNCSSYEIDTSHNSEYHYLTGHKIDGRVLFPAAGYLMLAWKSYAQLEGKLIQELPVSFENVRFNRATVLPEKGRVKFGVTLMPCTRMFEIIEGGSVVASGRILEQSASEIPLSSNEDKKSTSSFAVTSHDIYKELRLRGYEYEGIFKGILQTDLEGTKGKLRWTGNFVAFFDTMLQMMVLSKLEWDLRLPTSVKSVSLDPSLHLGRVQENELHAEVDTNSGQCISGGIKIAGLVSSPFPRRREDRQHKEEIYKLLPHDKAIYISRNSFEQQYVRICTQLASQIETSLSNSTPTEKRIERSPLTDMKHEFTVCSQSNNDIENLYTSKEFTLIKAFRKLLEMDKTKETNVAELFKGHSRELRKAMDEDGVFSSIIKPEYLKSCIDTVVENQNGRLEILELGEPNFKDSIVQLLGDYGSYITYSYDVSGKENSERTSMSTFSASKKGLIIADNMIHNQRDVRSFVQGIVKTLDDGGFALIKETTQHFLLQYIVDGFPEETREEDKVNRKYELYFQVEMLKDLFDSVGLLSVYEIHDPFLYSMFLLRKRNTSPLTDSKIIAVSSLDCQWLDDLKKGIKELNMEPNSGGNIWLYADNNFSGLIGMVKCLRKEPDGHIIRCVLNDKANNGMKVEEIVKRLLERNLAVNVVNNDGVGSYRSVPLAQEMVPWRSCGYFYVDVLTYGNLSSLTWCHTTSENFRHIASYQICKVQFSALNFRDVMLATGKLKPDAIPSTNRMDNCLLGMEFSGIDSNENRVMGIVPQKGLATCVEVGKEFVWMIPDDWSFADAASVPVVYSTAFYALIVRGQLNRGQRVLIHSGCGGVGQAAIRIAQSYDCEVFTTVGNEQKRAYLLSVFPRLKPENIFSSRDTSFEIGVMHATSGKGVHLVLNSLSGEKLRSSVNALAMHGRFLEIGKIDIFNDSELGMSIFQKNTSFHGILLDSLFDNDNEEWKRVFRLVEDGIHSGLVKPLKTTVFNSKNVEAAFRYMTQGKHIGKILIKVEIIQVCADDISEKLHAVPRFVCDSKKSYIIIGGLGGFGLELAQWLANRGARSIIVTSRTGIQTGYQARKIHKLQKMGIDIKVSRKSAGSMQEAEELIKECIMPCGGIFNTATVLDDGFIENQTTKCFQKVIEPKLTEAINLDKLTRLLCPTCDWFVMFSSFCSDRGNAGQSNYGFANSGMERICQQRKRDGLHGLAIQWGVIGDVGVVFEKHGSKDTEIAGTIPQSLTSCFSSLGTFLTQSAPVVASYVPATKQSSGKNESSVDPGYGLFNAVCNIIGIDDSSEIDTTSPLKDLGLDSLMTVEIKQTIERMSNVSFGTTDIRRLTMQKIKAMDKEGLNSNVEQTALEMNKHPILSLDDILIPTDLLVALNSNKNNTEPLYIIHMIEGTTSILRHVASFIERPVFGIQCTRDVPQNSGTDMAKYYLQVILEQNSFRTFHLAGHSFGGMVALEMAYQIQQSDVSSNTLLSLTLLDGTNLSTASTIRMLQQKLDIRDEKNTKSLMLAVLVGVSNDDSKAVWQELTTLPTFEERADLVLSKFTDNKDSVPRRDWLDAVERYCQRALIALAYKFQGVYIGDVVLIVPEHTTVEGKQLSSEQGLRQIVTGSLNVHTVSGRHVTFLQGNSGEQIARYINEELEI